jgi:hypothetical protein
MDAYSWLIIPIQEGTAPVSWSTNRVSGTENPVAKAIRKMQEEEYLINALSPKILSMEMSQFNLWKDGNSLSVKELWEDYTRYVYLHRIKNQSVLLTALESGIRSGEYFAYADGQDSSGRYEGLNIASDGFLHITLDGLVVKPDAAHSQLEKEKPKPSDNTNPDTNPPSVPNGDDVIPPQSVKAPLPTHFYGTVVIDLNKIGKHTGDINLEIIQHLKNLPNAQLTVKMDIEAAIPDGISDDITRIIRENCRTLKFESNEFE